MKSRDGKELVCVSCSSNKPDSQIQSVGTNREKQAEAIVLVDDSAHLQLLEKPFPSSGDWIFSILKWPTKWRLTF